MPQPTEPAEILLLDTMDEYRARKVDETRGWNLQQGTMFYWNPEAPDTQFFFNDRDPADGTIFTVLFDISRDERVREFRFPDSPVANSGVAQTGGSFLALNYGRLARLRLVTGSAGSADWSQAEMWKKQMELIIPVFSSNDAREGAVAFAEKRAPNWTGT